MKINLTRALLYGWAIAFFLAFSVSSSGAVAPAPDFSSMTDDQMLDSVERAAFNYFWIETNPQATLVQDRAHNFTASDYVSPYYSPVATGFGLVALCIAHEHGWLSRSQAYNRAKTMLDAFLNAPESLAVAPSGLVHYKGFFYHFVTADGSRAGAGSELSTIDTALFAAGALFCGAYFAALDNDVTLWNKADQIYKRIDWEWMRNGSKYLNWSWKPESGHSTAEISGYSEGIFAYIMAMGSPTHPLADTNGWRDLNRDTTSYRSLDYTYEKSNNTFFVHQYPLLFLHFSGMKDAFMSYAANTYKATLTQHRYAYDNRTVFSTYGSQSWGLGATDDPDGGYTAYGIGHNEDGTVALSNLFTAITEAPGPVISAMRHLYASYRPQLWGLYGFSDSYNIDASKTVFFNEGGMWRDPDIIGLQQGASMIAIENHRTGLIRNVFSSLAYIKNSLSTLGFATEAVPPARIDSLAARPVLRTDRSGVERIVLSWTAPGNDGSSGNISNGIYEVRFSTDPAFTWENAPANYLSCDTVWSMSAAAGNSESRTLTGISGAPFVYFRIRCTDDSFNWSPVSDAVAVYCGTAPFVSPASGCTNSAAPVTVLGHGFSVATAVALMKSGEPDIPAAGVSVQSQEKLICTFDLTGKATGYWDIVVTNPGPDTVFVARNAFLVSYPVGTDIKNVYAFPNPFRPLADTRGLAIANLPSDAEIGIYTLSGELLRTIEYTSADGRAYWDGKNSSGGSAASGVYIALIKTKTSVKRLKIAVLK